MQTRVYSTSEGDIEAAAAVLKAGGLIAMPTETVYGLAADAFNEGAVRNIFLAKGRPQDNPLIVHIADVEQIKDLCVDIPEGAFAVAGRFWPGPLTMILKKRDKIPDAVTCGLLSVGIRLPNNEAARALIRAVGTPLAAPSANRSGRPSPTTAGHVLEDMEGRIDGVVDGGACSVGLESTVLDMTLTPPRILRPGGVTLEELRTVLPDVVLDPSIYRSLKEGEKPRAPGQKYRHYAPRAHVTIVMGERERTVSYIQEHLDENGGVLCFDEDAGAFGTGTVIPYGSKEDKRSLARKLFDCLRAFDHTGVTAIYAQCPDDGGIGLAVANRLKKAAGFDIIQV